MNNISDYSTCPFCGEQYNYKLGMSIHRCRPSFNRTNNLAGGFTYCSACMCNIPLGNFHSCFVHTPPQVIKPPEPIEIPRKDKPVFSGVLQYFPDAILEISHHSKKGNDKHNPGQPLHWAKEKSKDHADCVARHLLDIGPNWDLVDPETQSYHATALAWRALALLQTLLERKNDSTKKE